MRLCHIVPSLEERHGGPSKSVRSLANHLVNETTSVDLLATAVESSENEELNLDLAKVHNFPRVAPQWLSRSPLLRRHLLDSRYDYIHHHSLWLLPLRYANEAAQLAKTPLVISPRGMMSPWAFNHRRAKKRLAEIFVHPGAFNAASGWHATSPEEAEDIRRLGFMQPICISPNGVNLPEESQISEAREFWHTRCPATKSRPVALFYSRFHRKKRLRELIDLWSKTPRGDWLLLIVGIAEDYSAVSLHAEITARGLNDQIAVFDGWRCPAPYAVASLFLLPSHSENFGLVVAEALAAGVPCLVTDSTPWQNLSTSECGWCIPWSDFEPTLARVLKLSSEKLSAMGKQGRQLVAAEYSWARVAALLRDFYPTLKK